MHITTLPLFRTSSSFVAIVLSHFGIMTSLMIDTFMAKHCPYKHTRNMKILKVVYFAFFFKAMNCGSTVTPHLQGVLLQQASLEIYFLFPQRGGNNFSLQHILFFSKEIF